MTESAVPVFNRLVAAEPPKRPHVRYETACVLGGSIAGLLAARVLADHARQLRPPLERLVTDTNYSTALFKRAKRAHREEQLPGFAIARFSPPYPVDGVLVAAVNAIENDQWIIGLMGYNDNKPGRTLGELIATCAKLQPVFREAVSGEPVVGKVFPYHQGDSRRRDFTGLTRFPAGLVSVGDAVASFNPVYGQGCPVPARCSRSGATALAGRGAGLPPPSSVSHGRGS